MITRERSGNCLTYRTSALSVNGAEVQLERAENTLRDQQQLAGLELRAARTPSAIVQSPHSIATRQEGRFISTVFAGSLNLTQWKKARQWIGGLGIIY